MLKNRPFSSHKMDGHYVILMETNGAEAESWYYFIRWEGNEAALHQLEADLNRVKEWYVLDDLSQFDLDLENKVSAQTAKEMGRVELNAFTYHRKFDGVLQPIDFEFRKKHLKDDERMMKRIFNKLGYGKIQNFIDDEDLDDDQVASDYGKNSSDDDSDDSDSSDSVDPRKIDKKYLPQRSEPSKHKERENERKKERELEHSNEKDKEKHREKHREKHKEKHQEKHREQPHNEKQPRKEEPEQTKI